MPLASLERIDLIVLSQQKKNKNFSITSYFFDAHAVFYSSKNDGSSI